MVTVLKNLDFLSSSIKSSHSIEEERKSLWKLRDIQINCFKNRIKFVHITNQTIEITKSYRALSFQDNSERQISENFPQNISIIAHFENLRKFLVVCKFCQSSEIFLLIGLSPGLFHFLILNMGWDM